MSTDTPTEAAPAEDTTTDVADDAGKESRIEAAKARQEVARLRKELKAREADSVELAKIREANKTEVEKANERVAQLEARAAAAELTALRVEVAAAKGLKPSQAKRLTGSTRDELEADADEMLSDMAADSRAPQPAKTPVERLKSGTVPAGEKQPVDGNEYLRALLRK